MADAINRHGNYDITVFHTFHDEVDSYRTHVWRCDGPCTSQPPYFGLVKRSMNRAPGKTDTWWAKHEEDCGGTYTKIQEPELTKKQKDAMSKKERAGLQKNKLDSWITTTKKPKESSGGKTFESAIVVDEKDKTSSKTSSTKRKAEQTILDYSVTSESPKRPRTAPQNRVQDEEIVSESVLVECPICSMRLAEADINEHLDVVHPP